MVPYEQKKMDYCISVISSCTFDGMRKSTWCNFSAVA